MRFGRAFLVIAIAAAGVECAVRWASLHAQSAVRPGPAGNRGAGPGLPGRGGGGPGLPGRPGLDAIVERLLAFDTDDDGQLTKEELNERLQDLVARGDVNADGALDPDEIRQLATTPPNFSRRAVFGAPPPPSPVPNGVRPPLPQGLEGIITDLKLAPGKRDAARRLIQPLIGNGPAAILPEAAASELLDRLKTILDDEEVANFKAALDRQRRSPFGIRISVPPAP